MPGKYRLTTSGIFFAFNSLVAISKGSVSPSSGTRTGAFILPGAASAGVPGVKQSDEGEGEGVPDL